MTFHLGLDLDLRAPTRPVPFHYPSRSTEDSVQRYRTVDIHTVAYESI